MSEEKSSSTFNDFVLVSLSFMLVVGSILCSFDLFVLNDWGFSGSGQLDHYYYSVVYPDRYEGCSDGWYSQREGVVPFNDWQFYNGSVIRFAICDHDYLGPLHGDWEITSGAIDSLIVDGYYNFRVENNIIIGARLREGL